MATFELTRPDGSTYQIDADTPDMAQKAFDHAFGSAPSSQAPATAPASAPAQGYGIGDALSNAGKFAFTAAARGLGGAADFLTDPLSPIRRMIDPRLEHVEQSIRQHPGQAAADTAFAATGIPEYQPGGAFDRILLSGAEGAAGGGPFGLGAAAIGGLSGLLGQGTHEAASRAGLSPNWQERLATAASLAPAGVAPLARGMTNAIVGKAQEALGPALSTRYREGLVGEQLRDATPDLGALQSSLMIDQPGPLNQSLVPGSAPTTFQFTGDMGLGQLERGARTADAVPFLDRAAEQNKARIGQVEALAPENASPSAVRDLLKQHLTNLDTEGEANIQRATQNAQQAFDLTGGQMHPGLYGALLRDQLESAKSIAKQNESRLWDAIDPNGTVTIGANPVAKTAKDILAEIPRTAKPPEGEEAAVLNLAQAGGTMPFSDFAALRGRLLQAIRDERANGQTPALRRMQILRSAMDDTISSAADQATQQEQGAVSQGTMQPEQTMAARLQALARAWQEENAGSGEAAAVSSGGAGSLPAGSAGRISSMGRGQGQARGGPGAAAGGEDLQSEPVANFDAETATRYREAANATRDRAQMFNNQIVGPALQERGSEYRMLDSRVPEQFLRTPEGVQAFLSAGGDPATLRDALASDLRRSASNTDGTLNPQKFAAWRNRRADALRAFPELDQTLGNAARAQEAVDAVSASARQRSLDYQKGSARYFLNAEPDKAVQAALSSKNPVADFRELARLVEPNPDAKAGLQRSVADYIARQYVGNTEAGTSGVGTVKSDAFQTFLRRNGPALAQIFSPEQMQSMRAVAADLQRSNRSIAGSKVPGQSNTAQDLAIQNGRVSLLRQHLLDAALGTGGGITGFLLGGIPGAALGGGLGVARAALARMKAAGLDHTNQLMSEALLNPELARTLLLAPNPANRPFIARRLRTAFGRIAGASAGSQASDQRL